MIFQNEPISVDKHVTQTVDNSNKLPTRNAVYDFVKEEINLAIISAVERG